MASLWDDFKLGLAGVSDLIGATNGLAAEVAVEQAAVDAGVTDPERIAEARASALEQERKQSVVREAAGTTIRQGVSVLERGAELAGDAVKFTVAQASSLTKPLAYGLGAAAVLGIVVFVAVKAKA